MSRKAYWDYVVDLIIPKDEHSPDEKLSISKKILHFYQTQENWHHKYQNAKKWIHYHRLTS